MKGVIFMLLVAALSVSSTPLENSQGLELERYNSSKNYGIKTKLLLDIKDTLATFEEYNHNVTSRVNDVRQRVQYLDSKVSSSNTEILTELRKEQEPDKCGLDVYYGNSYYRFASGRWTYSEAKRYCESFGSSLIKIDTSSEFQFVKDNIKLRLPSSCGYTWIGLDDISKEGTFRWVKDGSYQSINAIKSWFGDGNPDNFNNEDCVEFNYQTLELNDRNCNVNECLICEKSV